MVTQVKLKQSIFPDLPRNKPVVNKEGNFTDAWHLQFSSLFQALQRNFSNEGLQIPTLDNNDITTIQSLYGGVVASHSPLGNLPNISGQMVYNTTNNVPQMFIIVFTNNDPSDTVISASWKTFTLT